MHHIHIHKNELLLQSLVNTYADDTKVSGCTSKNVNDQSLPNSMEEKLAQKPNL